MLQLSFHATWREQLVGFLSQPFSRFLKRIRLYKNSYVSFHLSHEQDNYLSWRYTGRFGSKRTGRVSSPLSVDQRALALRRLPLWHAHFLAAAAGYSGPCAPLGPTRLPAA